MEQKINLIEKAYNLLVKIVSTKFGSAVVGFSLSGLIAYYSFVQKYYNDIQSLQSELYDIRKVNDSLRNKLSNVREEERHKARIEQQEYMDYIYEYSQKIREEVEKTNIKKTQEIKQIEREINKIKGS